LIGVVLLVAAGVTVILATLIAFIPLRVKFERVAKPFKERWIGPAALIAACAVLAPIGAVFFNSSHNTPQPNVQASGVPLKISITPPTGPVSPTGEAFSGSVQGLRPSQTIWLFSKQITNPNGPINSGVIAVNQGPCDVTGATWTCLNVGIGGSNPQDSGSYQVWVTVVEPWQARQLQDALVNSKSVVSGDEPPHTGSAIYIEIVTRLPSPTTSTSLHAGSATRTSSPPIKQLNLSVSCRVPSGVHEGEQITVVYAITSNKSVKVGLGAGVYDSGGTDHSTGTGDEDRYQLAAGTPTVTRIIALPSGLSSGQYEIDAEIWPSGEIGASRVNVLTEATCGFFKVP
jgi:hypothetical protein